MAPDSHRVEPHEELPLAQRECFGLLLKQPHPVLTPELLYAMEAPNATWGLHALTRLLGSEVRAKVIAQLCTHSNRPVAARELARLVSANQTAVSTGARGALAKTLQYGATAHLIRLPTTGTRSDPAMPGRRGVAEFGGHG